MKNLLVSAGSTLGTITDSSDMLDNAKLGDKVIACISSNGKVVTATANYKADYRGQAIQFVQGRGPGMNPKLGLKLNPFKLSYTINPYVAAVAKVVKWGYSVGVNATSSIILATDITANVGSIIGVRIVSMELQKPAYTLGVPFNQVETQITATDTPLTIQTRLKAKLDVLFAKLGHGLTATATNSTLYYGFDFTADAGYSFTVMGYGTAENTKVAVTTKMVFSEGAATDMMELEKTMATRDGYNASFHSNEELYTEESEVVTGATYDICIIESEMDPQYEIFQDHANMLVRQWIIMPTGGVIGTPQSFSGTTTVTGVARVPGTGIYLIADILDAVKAANK